MSKYQRPKHQDPIEELRNERDDLLQRIIELEKARADRRRIEDELLQARDELENRIKQRTAELDAERSRWKQVVQGIADEVWICDTQGRMSLVNLPSVTHMNLDEFKEKTVEQVLEDVEILNPDGQLRPPEHAPLLRSLGGEIVRGEEIMRHRTTGVTRWRQFSSAPIRDASGAIIGAVAVVRDVTEQKQAENERDRLTEKLRETADESQRRAAELEVSNKELQSFAYSVAHDLRAPLRHINSYSQLLTNEYRDKLDDQGKEYLKFLTDSSERMAQLIDDLLRLQQVTRTKMSRESVNLSVIVGSVAAELRKKHPDRSVDLSIAEELIAEGDPSLLRTALENLLDNAWKFTSPRPVAKIEFGATRHNRGTAYYVKDNGIGFNKAYVGELFGAFQRLHRAGEFPGTGIGLAIVQRIVQRHGGQVWAEGEVGKGATFYFTLG